MSEEQSVKYRAQFLTRPDLDSEDFKDYTGRIEIGREIEIERDDGKTWRVAEIKPDDGHRETIVFEPVR